MTENDNVLEIEVDEMGEYDYKPEHGFVSRQYALIASWTCTLLFVGILGHRLHLFLV